MNFWSLNRESNFFFGRLKYDYNSTILKEIKQSKEKYNKPTPTSPPPPLQKPKGSEAHQANGARLRQESCLQHTLKLKRASQAARPACYLGYPNREDTT